MVSLDFTGRSAIYAHHRTVQIRPLVPDKSKSLNMVDDDNLIIHGDNLRALKALLPHYAGRVDCIYIDPPYNTGNEGWVYNDRVNSPEMKRWLENAKEVDGEDLERHDKWMCMMWPRLQLLKELLAEDGVIFVSIDDNEQHRLRMMMDDIFGKECFISNIVVKSNPGGRDYGGVAKVHDYVMVYGNGVVSELDKIPIDEKELPMRDSWGGFELRELRNRNIRFNITNRPNLYYPFYVNPKPSMDDLHEVRLDSRRGWVKTLPLESQGIKTVWRWGTKKVLNETHNVIAKPAKDGTYRIFEKYRRTGVRMRSILDDKEFRNEAGTLMLKDIFGGRTVFDYPKSHQLIKQLLQLATNRESVILDSFAGAGTTAHAVLELNRQDGGNRKFILVELEDKYVDTVTAERVRHIIRGIPSAKDKTLREGTGGSFTFCTLGEPLDINRMLAGESLPDYSTLAAHLFRTATGMSVSKKLKPKNGDGLFHSANGTDYYLLYKPNPSYLLSDKSVLTDDRAKRIGSVGNKAVVFGSGKHVGQRDLARMGIEFCLIPDRIRQA